MFKTYTDPEAFVEGSLLFFSFSLNKFVRNISTPSFPIFIQE